MAVLAYDFSDLEKAKHFPAHGWATNSQGIKLLWCPMLTLLNRHDEALIRDGKVIEIRPAGGLPDGRPFAESLLKLATTLRELHRVVRIACDRSFVDAEPETLEEYGKAYELVPLYVDLAFVYLRRLPDLLIDACRPYLFEHWHSIPRAFKEWVAGVDRLRKFNPSCDFEILRRTIDGHSGWFNALRDTSPISGKKGIRDALEHRPVRLEVGARQVGDKRPEITVLARSYAGDVESNRDLVPVIRESVYGLSGLMTGLRSAIGGSGRYERTGAVSLVGIDDDVVGYWPPIDG